MTEDEKLKEYMQRMREGSFREKAKLLDALTKQFGPEIKEAAIKFVIQDSKEFWAKVAEKEGSNDIPALIRTLWESAEGLFDFTYEEKDGGVQMHVTRCPFADIGKKLGGEEWGFALYCMSDYGIVEGFNPEIDFKRTKTLMEGHDCCDHFYKMKK